MAFFPGFPSVPLICCSFRSKFRRFCQVTGAPCPALHTLPLPGHDSRFPSSRCAIRGKLVERLRRRIAAESPSHIRQHPQAIRMTLLAALVFQRTQEVTDALVTLLIQIVHRIGKRAERRVESAYINDLKRVAGKTRILYRIADAALEHPDDPVRQVVFPIANEQTLRDLVAEYKAQGGAYRQQVQQVMRSSYRNHYRQILPALLDVLDFHSNNTAYQPVIEALAVVREYVESRIAWYPAEISPPIEGVVPSTWENIVTEKDSAGEERVNRLTYELSVLQTLCERVRSKEIWVAGAAQFRDYVEYTKSPKSGLVLPIFNSQTLSSEYLQIHPPQPQAQWNCDMCTV